MGKTKIQVSEEVWRKLIALKNLGESFDDVLTKILNEYEESHKWLKNKKQ